MSPDAVEGYAIRGVGVGEGLSFAEGWPSWPGRYLLPPPPPQNFSLSSFYSIYNAGDCYRVFSGFQIPRHTVGPIAVSVRGHLTGIHII